jgi:hypothetical protein
MPRRVNRPQNDFQLSGDRTHDDLSVAGQQARGRTEMDREMVEKPAQDPSYRPEPKSLPPVTSVAEKPTQESRTGALATRAGDV